MKRNFYKIILTVITLGLSISIIAQNLKTIETMNRKAVVAGQFYPGNKESLYDEIKNLFANKKSSPGVSAVISPHAGYIFSGGVAASSISQIDPERKYKNVFIIASSHTCYFDGASVYNIGNYETPLGEVKVNTELCNDLIENHDIFSFNPAAHRTEHSVEVQLPLLQYWLKNDFRIVPIVIGADDTGTPKKIAGALKSYFNEDNIFVISTDFSHYPSSKEAVVIDKETADAICSGDPDTFIELLKRSDSSETENLATNICGWSSVLTLMYMTGKDYEYHQVEYKNSGDSPYGSPDRVVGYWAISVTRSGINNDYVLSDNDKKELLKIARTAVETRVLKNKDIIPDIDFLSGNLKEHCGAFVTLHENSELRGCIGRFEPDIPLYQVVAEMAVAAAINDYRFSPVGKEELDKIDYEISVLTPMRKIESINEIELGKHGIYIKKGNRGGTFLPQVVEETGWTLEEFLGYCARDKAGLTYTGWKDADIYIYEAIVFSEKDFETDENKNVAKYYEKLANNMIKCTLCPHYCTLAESKTGFCKARQNVEGELHSLSYEKSVAIHIDPVEKKPLYHFYPGTNTLSFGTAGCNMNCKNCQNSHISQVSPDNIEFIEAAPAKIVQAAIESGCNSISYTYTEPTVFYEYMLETAKLAHEKGLKNIMVSNGFINKEPLLELIPYLDAANIDLKCFNDSIYREITSARLDPVLNTLKTLKENDVWLEITNLIIPGWTDDMNMISEMCDWLVENGFEDVPLHFSRFFPSYKMSNVKATTVEMVEKAADIARSKGIKHVYLGNVRDENIYTSCDLCGEKLIERTGFQTKQGNFKGICNKCGTKISGVWE